MTQPAPTLSFGPAPTLSFRPAGGILLPFRKGLTGQLFGCELNSLIEQLNESLAA